MRRGRASGSGLAHREVWRTGPACALEAVRATGCCAACAACAPQKPESERSRTFTAEGGASRGIWRIGGAHVRARRGVWSGAAKGLAHRGRRRARGGRRRARRWVNLRGDLGPDLHRREWASYRLQRPPFCSLSRSSPDECTLRAGNVKAPASAGRATCWRSQSNTWSGATRKRCARKRKGCPDWPRAFHKHTGGHAVEQSTRAVRRRTSGPRLSPDVITVLCWLSRKRVASGNWSSTARSAGSALPKSATSAPRLAPIAQCVQAPQQRIRHGDVQQRAQWARLTDA